jgi:acyl phosphate:glycerol-3-phosphate acyltransferase
MMLPMFETPVVILVLVGVAGYLLGSIPFGMVVARMMGLGNLRDIGSGNIGATNVLRTGNKLAAFLTLVLDSGKGAIAVLIAAWMFAPDAAQTAGLLAFLGHLFPVWLGFKGGKGVATFLGIILALSFVAGLGACAAWLATAVVFRYSSLAGLVAVATAPIWLYSAGAPSAVALAAALAALIWWRHKDNITRLLGGTETKIGKKG